jgi:voltage-gated potassium channel
MKGGGNPEDVALPVPSVPIRLPHAERGPLRLFLNRLAIALGLIVFVAMLTWLGRDGYADADGTTVNLLDSFYYSTVSITTTGYGDVRPESDEARLVTTLLITPARILFLIVLVGTTVEILAARTREAFEERRWRSRLKDHTIICGYGTKGRAAMRTLCSQGRSPDSIVVIDNTEAGVKAAGDDGLAVIVGDATRVEVLRRAEIEIARAVVVAPQRDDTAVLVTLTARELNPKATIVAAVREEENVHLLRQSGADSVITSSSAAGRLLGLATTRPRVVEVLEDLITVGRGLDIIERAVEPHEAGKLVDLHFTAPVLAVVRGDQICRFDDPNVAEVRAGDRIVTLASHTQPHEPDGALP